MWNRFCIWVSGISLATPALAAVPKWFIIGVHVKSKVHASPGLKTGNLLVRVCIHLFEMLWEWAYPALSHYFSRVFCRHGIQIAKELKQSYSGLSLCPLAQECKEAWGECITLPDTATRKKHWVHESGAHTCLQWHPHWLHNSESSTCWYGNNRFFFLWKGFYPSRMPVNIQEKWGRKHFISGFRL